MEKQPYIGKWISVLYRLGQSYFDYRFEKLGIGCGNYAFLLNLFRREGVSQDMLSKTIHVDKTTTTRALDKLEDLGYIIRLSEPADKRAHRIYLTEQARGLEAEIREVLKDWATILTEGFSQEEKDIAYQLLNRMAENALGARSLKSEGWK